MTKTEYLEQICINLGIDTSQLPDRLFVTYLSAIVEKLGVMKENGTLSEYLTGCANQYVTGVEDGKILGREEIKDMLREEIREEVSVEVRRLTDALEVILFGTKVGNTLDKDVSQVESDFNSIKDKITNKGVEVADGIPTSEYATKIDDVYTKGYEQGKSEGGNGGGSSDPAAEAVMALIRQSSKPYECVRIGPDNKPTSCFIHLPMYDNNTDFIIIPETITNIDEDALACGTLYPDETRVLSLPTNPPEMTWQSTWSVNGGNKPPLVIYVPDKSVDAYKAAENWSEFADLIKPMSLIFKEFWINGICCQADEGMTWEEWIASEYYNAETNIHVNTELVGEAIIVADDSCPLYGNDAGFQYPTIPIVIGTAYRNA